MGNEFQSTDSLQTTVLTIHPETESTGTKMSSWKGRIVQRFRDAGRALLERLYNLFKALGGIPTVLRIECCGKEELASPRAEQQTLLMEAERNYEQDQNAVSFILARKMKDTIISGIVRADRFENIINAPDDQFSKYVSKEAFEALQGSIANLKTNLEKYDSAMHDKMTETEVLELCKPIFSIMITFNRALQSFSKELPRGSKERKLFVQHGKAFVEHMNLQQGIFQQPSSFLYLNTLRENRDASLRKLEEIRGRMQISNQSGG